MEEKFRGFTIVDQKNADGVYNFRGLKDGECFASGIEDHAYLRMRSSHMSRTLKTKISTATSGDIVYVCRESPTVGPIPVGGKFKIFTVIENNPKRRSIHGPPPKYDFIGLGKHECFAVDITKTENVRVGAYAVGKKLKRKFSVFSHGDLAYVCRRS